VVNLVDESIAEAMNKCAASLPYGENELLFASLRAAPSSAVKPPRIRRVASQLGMQGNGGRCRSGATASVIGLVRRVHLREDLFDVETKRVRSDKLFLIGRMAAPHWYCRTRDRFEMIRPH